MYVQQTQKNIIIIIIIIKISRAEPCGTPIKMHFGELWVGPLLILWVDLTSSYMLVLELFYSINMFLISLSIDSGVCNRKSSINALRLLQLYPLYLDLFSISLLLETEHVASYIHVGSQNNNNNNNNNLI